MKFKFRRKSSEFRRRCRVFILFGLLCLITLIESKCPRSCGNGVCVKGNGNDDGKCKCFPGWRGAECSLCGGKVRLEGEKGWLADATGNYTVDSKCTWLIQAPSVGSIIRLHIKEFATECGWDHLYIYDGDSVFSKLSAVYSGMVRQDRYNIQRVPELVGHSGSMLIHFYSDVAYNMTGFNITFSLDSCPSQRHDLTCSGHGTCVKGKCKCDADFKGLACSVPACPKNCAANGSRRGKCNKEKKQCDCDEGWIGEACSQSITKGYWRPLTSVRKPLSPARTSHVSLADSDGVIWIVGGETFSHSHHIVSNLTLDIPSGTFQWHEVRSKSEKGPSPRYGHSAVIHDGKLYMYGGTMRSGHTSKEIWALDLESLIWKRIVTQPGTCMNSGHEVHELCGPVHNTGHTATVIANRMIVIFGHSPTYGYLNIVQEYHFGNKEWSIVDTIGYPVRGGFGHSAAWDKITNLIYVYGGYISTASTTAALSEDLYSYNPIAKRWRIHRSSNSYRYLHSAVISNGLMIVFGGNTHNDTSWSHGAKCYSTDLIVYDIACDRWYDMEDSFPSDLNIVDLARFGHSGIMLNAFMVIIGGFHGMLKNDVLTFVPGQCQIYKDRTQCLTAQPGVKCIWNRKKESCETAALPNKSSGGLDDICFKEENPRNLSQYCSKFDSSCSSCLSTSVACVWCGEGECSYRVCRNKKGLLNGNSDGDSNKKKITSLEECLTKSAEIILKETCASLHTCHFCVAHSGCQWSVDKVSKCREKKKFSEGNLTDEPDEGSKCTPACSDRKTCSNCTLGLCMWCNNLAMCIDRNAYLSSFPYGQCMDWTTQSDSCPQNETLDICADYSTCESCRANPRCGWCDDGSGTGLGSCQVGGAKGPLFHEDKSFGHWLPADTCQASEGKTWHFISCPVCQCNGHSNCPKKLEVCDQPCKDHTEGEHCQRCSDGFFGNPVNGGPCTPCQCNGQASTCNHRSGRCHCTTKGIIGDNCEKCDKQNHYFGDPVKESCFYDLAIDYQFTFNLSKPEDRHYRVINFKNVPTKADVDVDFSVECSVAAKMNLTFRYIPLGSKETREETIFSEKNCSEKFKNRFSKSEFSFGSEENTTFYVYVYDFQPPLWIVISFSQHPKLDLLQFFITFSTCFLALLLVAAIMWKIKQKYDRYRRRQRLFVEMEQMASRPFGSVLVEMERLPDTTNAAEGSAFGDTSSHLRKRRKKSRPSPIALEPCLGNRAAVLSLIVRLPTGGKPYTLNGYTGIAVASSLVTLGNPRKTSTDVQNRQSLEDPKSGRKARKGGSVGGSGGGGNPTPSGGSNIAMPADL